MAEESEKNEGGVLNKILWGLGIGIGILAIIGTLGGGGASSQQSTPMIDEI